SCHPRYHVITCCRILIVAVAVDTFVFFYDPTSAESYTLSLHDALPILLAENEKIRPILAQLEKLLLCDLSPSTNDSELRKDRSKDRKSGSAEMPRPISYAVFCLKKKHTQITCSRTRQCRVHQLAGPTAD